MEESTQESAVFPGCNDALAFDANTARPSHNRTHHVTVIAVFFMLVELRQHATDLSHVQTCSDDKGKRVTVTIAHLLCIEIFQKRYARL